MNHRRHVWFKSALILILTFGFKTRPACAQTELDAALALESALVKVIAETEKSVVSIARIKNNPDAESIPRLNRFGFRDRTPRDGPDSPDFEPNEFGAGVILARRNEPDSRYILTNYHVVAGGPVSRLPLADYEAELYVKLADGHSYFATIRAADPRSNLAVLDIDFDRLQLKPSDLKPLRLPAPETALRKGQIVIGLGNPYAIAKDGSASASWGIISNLRRRPKLPPEPESIITEPEESLHHTGTLLQVDMKINIGSSGGALVNLKGEFVGLMTSLAAIEGYDTAAGFAIPVDEHFLRIFETLSRGQEVEYGFLGVRLDEETHHDSQRDLPIPQASAPSLLQVFYNSPARRAGLREHDLILKINGQTVLDRRDLMREISLLPPDAQARLTVWRRLEASPFDVTVRLGKWPARRDEEIIVTNPRYPRWRGLMVDYPTARNRFLNLTFPYPDAVVIRDVLPGSVAAEAGLQSGEFIASVQGRSVTRPAEFYDAIRNAQGNVALRLLDGRELSLPAPPSPTP